MSKLAHPNITKLLGACTKAQVASTRPLSCAVVTLRTAAFVTMDARVAPI